MTLPDGRPNFGSKTLSITVPSRGNITEIADSTAKDVVSNALGEEGDIKKTINNIVDNLLSKIELSYNSGAKILTLRVFYSDGTSHTSTVTLS